MSTATLGSAAQLAETRTSTETIPETPRLPMALWFDAPIAAIFVLCALSIGTPDLYRQWVISENGLIAWATPLLLLVAIVFGALALRRARSVAVVAPEAFRPATTCIPAAVIFLLLAAVERTGSASRWLGLIEPAKVRDLYLAAFLAFYAAGLFARLRRQSA